MLFIYFIQARYFIFSLNLNYSYYNFGGLKKIKLRKIVQTQLLNIAALPNINVTKLISYVDC